MDPRQGSNMLNGLPGEASPSPARIAKHEITSLTSIKSFYGFSVRSVALWYDR